MAKKCKVCKQKFQPYQPLQSVCDWECALIEGQKKTKKDNRIKERQEKKEFTERKIKIRTRSEWLKLAQVAFNKFIRLRDQEKACVSCGRFHQGQWHAGHYMPTSTRPTLRFDEDNVHKQCQPCNTHLHGNLVNYRIELIYRIGLEKVEWLESDQHEPKKYTIEELRLIEKYYKDKYRELLDKC